MLSTYGLLFSDLRNDFVRTYVRALAACDASELGAAFAGLDAQATAWLDQEGVPAADRAHDWFATLRYVSQMFELTLPWPGREVTPAVLGRLAQAFHARHEQLYTYCSPDAPVELVTLRVQATGRLPKLAVPPLASAAGDARPTATRPVYFRRGRGFELTAVFARDALAAGSTLAGPAVIEQMDTTTLVPPGWDGRVDVFGNLLLERAASG